MDILIEQVNSTDANMITESSSDGKTMWLTGICMQSSIKNRNNRVYPLHEISNAVASVQQRIKENNGIFGELEHPTSLQINADRISHVITEMWMNGNDAYAKAKLLNTPMGLIAQELLKSGVRVGVSSRGAGNVNESGEVSGFVMQTFDIVITPSGPNCTPNVVYESLVENNKIMTLAENVRQDLSAQKYLKQEILKWLSSGLLGKK